APARDPAFPTEVPHGAWDMAVFENRFPSLGGPVAVLPELIVPTAQANGPCEVVVFTQDAGASLGTLPLDHIALLFEVLADRTSRLGAAAAIQYVLPFENRGVECGVTLHHPHGQIYAYPLVPPVPARMQQLAGEHYARHARGLLVQHIEAERKDAVRMLYEGEHAVAFVPVCARYPYEVWVAPIRPAANFAGLTDAERADLARALKTVLRKYDLLWDRPFPYLMAWYQAPTDGLDHPESHLHAQLWPPHRTRERLKFLAGTELGAGFFAMDVLPEDKARELQQVEVGVL
ncbi:MAG: galactose-1-phosphate uridylyltransferase, partial [Bdellovibrionales bacterium]|nr:galactose-1-phosphate uridylyltransferase [Ramlibacter sp.]